MVFFLLLLLFVITYKDIFVLKRRDAKSSGKILGAQTMFVFFFLYTYFTFLLYLFLYGFRHGQTYTINAYIIRSAFGSDSVIQ